MHRGKAPHVGNDVHAVLQIAICGWQCVDSKSPQWSSWLPGVGLRRHLKPLMVALAPLPADHRPSMLSLLCGDPQKRQL